jgi:hypothetical protein
MLFSLFINDAGESRFDVVRFLTHECEIGFADAKLILAGVRTKLMTAEMERLRRFQEILEKTGAHTVVEVHAAGLSL